MPSFVENINKLANGLSGSLVDELSYIKTKLSNIADGSTKNKDDAYLLDRANHTGMQSIDTIKESETGKILTADERVKLASLVPHPAKHPVSILDGNGNFSKFVKTDAIGGVGFDNVMWSDIQGKPSSFNPNAHQHTLSDLSDAILKADKTYVDTQLATKVDTSKLTTELAKKADANTVATDAELQAAVATLQPLSQKGQANGYVPLDSAGKIPNSYLNNLSTIEVFTANSQANMLLLSNVSVGDQCIRTDLASNNLFILTQTPATDINNWKQINTSASVMSVNGQTGVVNVSKSDVGLGNVDNTSDATKNVLSATKLTTSRTIALSGDATGSTSFDGSANATITVTVADNSHNHTLSNISDFPSTVSATEIGYLDGVTGAIQTQLNAKQDALTSGTTIKTINGSTILGSGDLIIAGCDMMKSTYDSTNNGIVDRAEVADKLTVSKTINGVSFDGSANINIEGRLATAIASAATTTIGTVGNGETVHITGTTAITSLGVATTGTIRNVIFDAALVLTYNATSLMLPTNANITTAAGDMAIFVCENGASGYWRCIAYQRRTGYPLTLGNLSTTGSAATLTTSRTINGVSFNGSANINIEDRIGTAIASATTTTIGTAGLGDYIHITGTVAITSFGTAATAGIRRTLIFDSDGVVITHNATSLICTGAENITTVAGTVIEVVAETTANWRVVSITHPSISATELGYLDGVTSAIQTQINAKQSTLVSGTNIKTINSNSLLGSGDIVVGETAWASNDSRAKTALNANGTAPIYACRAWVNFNGTGTVAIRASGNVSSITDNGVGNYTVNFATAMADANYSVSSFGKRQLGTPIQDSIVGGYAISASQLAVYTTNGNGAYEDFSDVHIHIVR